jgi:hypothetical protein
MESVSLETVDACSGDEIWWGESSAIFADCLIWQHLWINSFSNSAQKKLMKWRTN